MHGIKRILVFCTLTTILPILLLVTPLYLRYNFYANVAYAVMDSDILEITDGISTIFCSAHTLQMNRTFNAFQMSHKPEITSYRKHIRLKKSMVLPDDTLEYWGFYLLGGSSVALSVCSRFEGASILVVKGERNLRTCGMLEHHNTQIAEGIFLPEAKKQVKVTFKSNAEQINSNNTIIQNNYNETLNDIEDILLWDHTLNNTDQNIGAHYPYLNSFMSNMENYEEEEKKELLQHKNIQHIIRSLEKETIHTTRRLRHARKKKYKMQMKETRKNITLQEREKAQKNLKINSYFKRDIYNKYSLFLKRLQRSLNLEDNGKGDINNEMNVQDKKESKKRIKRNQGVVNPTLLFDQGVQHGGNAGNVTDTNEDSSVSSFENELFKCYGGSILMAQEFAPSEKCTDVTYLLNGKHMQAVHNVIEDGYYYYIFYSDNDIVSNDIYALFDIYKPIFHYENITNSCINQTKCSFSINMLSSDRVIVEIPTKDGLEYEIDDVNLLLSICHPRMEVYIIFPVAVLFFILTCAFM